MSLRCVFLMRYHCLFFSTERSRDLTSSSGAFMQGGKGTSRWRQSVRPALIAFMAFALLPYPPCFSLLTVISLLRDGRSMCRLLGEQLQELA